MLNTCDYLVLHAGVPCFARALAYASWFVPDVFNFASLILLNSARRNFSYSSLMWVVFVLSFIAFFVADNALILFFQLLPVVLILARLTPPSSSFSVRQLEYWIVYASLWITLSLANLQDCDRIKYNIDAWASLLDGQEPLGRQSSRTLERFADLPRLVPYLESTNPSC